MKASPSLVILCSILCLQLSLWANGPVKNGTGIPDSVFYPATLSEGWIGYSPNNPLDSPADNVFEIEINTAIGKNQLVWLTYEVYGVIVHH